MNVYGWGRINDLAYDVHNIATNKGFWEHAENNPSIFAEKIALIHSEVSEILEARRDHDDKLEAEECADVVIRVMDYAEARGFNLEQSIVNKIEKNRGRPYLHGKGNG